MTCVVVRDICLPVEKIKLLIRHSLGARVKTQKWSESTKDSLTGNSVGPTLLSVHTGASACWASRHVFSVMSTTSDLESRFAYLEQQIRDPKSKLNVEGLLVSDNHFLILFIIMWCVGDVACARGLGLLPCSISKHLHGIKLCERHNVMLRVSSRHNNRTLSLPFIRTAPPLRYSGTEISIPSGSDVRYTTVGIGSNERAGKSFISSVALKRLLWCASYSIDQLQWYHLKIPDLFCCKSYFIEAITENNMYFCVVTILCGYSCYETCGNDSADQ